MADLEPCFKWEPPSDVLKAYKKATGQYNRPRPPPKPHAWPPPAPTPSVKKETVSEKSDSMSQVAPAVTTQPDTTQPDTTQPDTTQPVTTQPDTTQPDTGPVDQVQEMSYRY
ncbi:unnamed protein product [Boreogadus saida]